MKLTSQSTGVAAKAAQILNTSFAQTAAVGFGVVKEFQAASDALDAFKARDPGGFFNAMSDSLSIVGYHIGNVTSNQELFNRATEIITASVADGTMTFEEATAKIQEYADRLGIDLPEGAAATVTALTGVVAGTDAATAATEKGANATDNATAALRRHAIALQEDRLALISGAGTLLGLVGSLQEAAKAQREYEKLVRQGKQGTAEFSEAVTNAVSTQQAFREQMRQFSADNPGKTFNQIRSVMKELAVQQGITARDFKATFQNAFDDIGNRWDNLHAKLRQPLVINVDTSAGVREIADLKAQISSLIRD
jgi:polyhydroxyalkanoate synthesis regulator phasin